MKAFRKSMKKPQSPLAVAGSRMSLKGLTSSKKHLSLKKLDSSKSSKSDSNLFIGMSELGSIARAQETKTARIQHHAYFEGSPALEEISLATAVEVTQLNMTQKTLRASFKKPKRHHGNLQLGDGQIRFLLGSDMDRSYEVGNIESLLLKSMKVKEFVIKFYKDPRVFSVKCENAILAQNWVRQIIIETRKQCHVFSKLLDKLLPQDWAEALQTSSRIRDQEVNRMLTVLEDKEKQTVENCLRELVDLTGLAKGKDHVDYFEMCEKFSQWLILHDKQEEATFWTALVKQGLLQHDEKRKIELEGLGNGTFLGKKLDDRASALDAIRNPVDLNEQTEMRTKSFPANLESRLERIEQKMAQIDSEAEATGADRYEQLI